VYYPNRTESHYEWLSRIQGSGHYVCNDCHQRLFHILEKTNETDEHLMFNGSVGKLYFNPNKLWEFQNYNVFCGYCRIPIGGLELNTTSREMAYSIRKSSVNSTNVEPPQAGYRIKRFFQNLDRTTRKTRLKYEEKAFGKSRYKNIAGGGEESWIDREGITEGIREGQNDFAEEKEEPENQSKNFKIEGVGKEKTEVLEEESLTPDEESDKYFKMSEDYW
jgi:hypothetical protein